MRLVIKKDYNECSSWTADYIAARINQFNPAEEKKFVLGLPTGSTPLGIYKKLIEYVQQKKLSFRNVITFNMDEYVGLTEYNDQSYHYFMHKNFFNHIDILPENIHILNGCAQDLQKECEEYENKIKECGGINLFLGGTGCDGHIAFNEPGSSLKSRTRIKTLTTDTRIVNSRFFGGDMNKVPKTALTVGIETITDSEEVVIMMNGPAKSLALKHAVEDSVSQMWPVTALQMHRQSIIVADEPCTEELKVGTVKYFKNIENSIANA